MPTPRAASGSLEKAAPITWPSLSEIASWLYGRTRGLDTLGREARRLGVVTRKIGRELRIEPSGAVRVLEARGVTAQRATELVTQAVATRTREVPALNIQPSVRPATPTRRDDPYASMSPALTAAMREYEKQMFGASPGDMLPNNVATDIVSTEDLLRPVVGARP